VSFCGLSGSYNDDTLATQQRRDHLAQCLESGELEQFPRDDTRQHRGQRKVTRLSDGDSGVEVLQ